MKIENWHPTLFFSGTTVECWLRTEWEANSKLMADVFLPSTLQHATQSSTQNIQWLFIYLIHWCLVLSFQLDRVSLGISVLS